MLRSRWLVLLAVWWGGAAAAAETPLTLGWALDEAQRANPELRALAGEQAAAWERVPQARALADPTLALQLWNFPFDRRPGAGSMVMLQLAQPLPWPGKRALRGEVAAASARIAGENVRTRALEVVAAVKRLYYRLWLNGEARAINRRNQELVAQFRRAALARVPAGGGSVTDVLRAETEAARLRADLVILGRERLAVAAALNVQLGRPADAPLGEPEADFPAHGGYDYATLVAAAVRRRPDLHAADLAVGRADAQIALARKNRFPDVVPSVMFMQDVAMGPSWGAMVGVTIPLFAGQKQGRAIREASASAGAARERQRAARLEIERQVREALVTLESADERVRLLRDEVVPKARTALEATLAGYVTGRDGLTAVLDGRRVLQDLELEQARARAEVEQARAELARAVGGRLPDDRP